MPARRPDSVVPVGPAGPVGLVARPAVSQGGTLFESARALAARLTPLDIFAGVNVSLFLCMCVFTYYARFIHYRGAANVWEFFVYAAVLIAIVGLLWKGLRHQGYTFTLLAFVQAGILAHFAGAFIHVDGHRLYDVYLAGVRYDKYVHFANAFIVTRFVHHTLVHRGVRFDGAVRLATALTVVGLGAIVEIVEYLVLMTVPGNGVGGYDNNMQDLVANLCGSALSAILIGSSRFVRLPRRSNSQSARASAWWFNLGEILLLVLGVLATVWLAPRWLAPLAFARLAAVMALFALWYVTWVSPVLLHGDVPADRGLGSRATFFVRTDNLREAARAFGILTIIGAVGITVLASVWNPGWMASANWKSWLVRLLFYGPSAYLQAWVFVGFGLVRLKRAVGPLAASRLGLAPDDWRTHVVLASIAAAIFGALHAPSLTVVGLTLVFGFWSAWIGLRTPNVLAAAGCQLILGLLVHRGLELNVRPGYFQADPDLHVFRNVLPFVGQIIGTLY